MKNCLLILSALAIAGASCLTARAQAAGTGTVAVERVAVIGNVQRPQEVLFSQGLTLTRALDWTGGALADSDLKRVKIFRDNGTKDGDTLLVNLKAVRDGKEKDFILRPYDIVCVPSKKSKGEKCIFSVRQRLKPELPSRVIY